MSGPQTVRRSWAGPTGTIAVAPASRSTSSSNTGSSAITRDAAEHFWPAYANALCVIAGTATSRSASVSTTTGFLPPISASDPLHLSLPGLDDRRALDDLQADRLRPREHDERDRWVLDQIGADLLADAGQEGQHTGRDARLVEDLDQTQRDSGRLLRRLEQHRVAGDQRGGDHAGGDREREVPRRDHDADAERLVGVRVGFARDLADATSAREAERLASVVLAEVDRLAHVGVGLDDRLAGFEDLERGQLDAPRAQDRGRPEQDRRSFVPRDGAPRRPRGRGDVERARRQRQRSAQPLRHTTRSNATRVDRHDLAVGRDDLDRRRGRARRSRGGPTASPTPRARRGARRGPPELGDAARW